MIVIDAEIPKMIEEMKEQYDQWWIDDIEGRVCGPWSEIGEIPWPDNEKVYRAIDYKAYEKLIAEVRELSEHKKLLFEENGRLLEEKEAGLWDANHPLRAEKARLTEALEFYAEEKNYLNQPERGGTCRLFAPSDEDQGKIARKALEGKC